MIVAFQLTSVRSLLLLLKTLHNAFVISEVCNRSLCVIPFKTEMAKSQEPPPPPPTNFFFFIKKLSWPLTRSVLIYARNFQAPAMQATCHAF